MARSRLTNTTLDLIADGGAVLWSFVKGEQLEFPIVLNFVEDASIKTPSNLNYVYEAVVVEAANVSGQTEIPVDVRVGGIQDKLVIRIPRLIGTWGAGSAYNKEEVVLHVGKYYKLTKGAGITTGAPTVDPLWVETTLNTIYLRFPSTMAATWSVQPKVDSPVYGFFELRVTEPTDSMNFPRTFKPVRGMVEILFSPTDVTVDVNQTVT
jgi:hypothetical protein